MYFKKIVVLFLICPVILISITGCAASGTSNPSPSDNATQPPQGVHLPPPLEIDRGNPKLEYVLVELIRAEKRGEAESFARQRVLNLRDSSVLVDIWTVPGQAETAAKAATSAGARLTSSLYSQGFDAFVPITSLDALANEKSIYRITSANAGQPGSN